MHFDGKLPWREAEALALADVLCQDDPVAAPEGEPGNAEESAALVQAGLFAAEGSAGPYARGL